MSSHPRRKDLFVAWSKAMVEGATVDKPNYGKTTQSKKSHRHKRTRRSRITSRRKRNAKKE